MDGSRVATDGEQLFASGAAVDATPESKAATVYGLRMLRGLEPLLRKLRPLGAERDVAGNRKLHMDDAVGLVLLSFFNPVLRTLHDLVAASQLPNVRKKLGCNATSLGSLSESLRLFPAEALQDIVDELAGRLPNAAGVDPRLKALGLKLGAFDGSVLQKLVQASQAKSRRRRGAKLHLQFEVLKLHPSKIKVTEDGGRGEAGEKPVLRTLLEPERCYLVDRGYEEFSLFNDIRKAKSSYVCRVRNDHHFQVENSPTEKANELTAEAIAAGVIEDQVGRMGSEKSKRIEHPDHVQRRVVIQYKEHPRRGGRRDAASHDIVLVTNLLDVPAEVIALLYKHRWLVELFFRWLKCVFGCRHLISQNHNGIELQMYCAVIAFLLIQLNLGGRVQPNSWTYKLLCLREQGLATDEDVLAHLAELERAAERKAAKEGAGGAAKNR